MVDCALCFRIILCEVFPYINIWQQYIEYWYSTFESSVCMNERGIMFLVRSTMTNSNEAKVTQIVFYIHVIVAVWNRLVL